MSVVAEIIRVDFAECRDLVIGWTFELFKYHSNGRCRGGALNVCTEARSAPTLPTLVPREPAGQLDGENASVISVGKSA